MQKCPPTSQLWQTIHGTYYPLELQQMGLVIEILRGANWQRARGKGNRPKPIRWPWATQDEVSSIGQSAPFEDVRDHLLLLNGRAP